MGKRRSRLLLANSRKIEFFMHKCKIWNYEQLSQRSGVALRTIVNVMNNKGITNQYLDKIAKALGVDIEDILDDFNSLVSVFKTNPPDPPSNNSYKSSKTTYEHDTSYIINTCESVWSNNATRLMWFLREVFTEKQAGNELDFVSLQKKYRKKATYADFDQDCSLIDLEENVQEWLLETMREMKENIRLYLFRDSVNVEGEYQILIAPKSEHWRTCELIKRGICPEYSVTLDVGIGGGMPDDRIKTLIAECFNLAMETDDLEDSGEFNNLDNVMPPPPLA